MGLNLNINTNFARRRRGVIPTENLQYNYSQSAEGADLVDSLGNGVDVPFVSGTGLDQLFDFSVLNDDRFDKGSYLGNALALPEYYDFPYVGVYYDPTSATTRNYWKLIDFAYAVILAQTYDVAIQNNYFLKATATTDTSNVIDSVEELLIYSVAQVNGNLSQLKSYIGIQPDFYGDNLIPSASSDFETDGTGYWSANKVANTWNSTNKSMLSTCIATANNAGIYKAGLLTAGETYLVRFKAKSSVSVSKFVAIGDNDNTAIEISNPNITPVYQDYEFLITPTQTLFRAYLNVMYIGEVLEWDDIIVEIYYNNYYKS